MSDEDEQSTFFPFFSRFLHFCLWIPERARTETLPSLLSLQFNGQKKRGDSNLSCRLSPKHAVIGVL